jgi:hypothetical protein
VVKNLKLKLETNSLINLGTEHTLKLRLSEIISLVPSQTELLHDLGLEARMVGITKFVCIRII